MNPNQTRSENGLIIKVSNKKKTPKKLNAGSCTSQSAHSTTILDHICLVKATNISNSVSQVCDSYFLISLMPKLWFVIHGTPSDARGFKSYFLFTLRKDVTTACWSSHCAESQKKLLLCSSRLNGLKEQPRWSQGSWICRSKFYEWFLFLMSHSRYEALLLTLCSRCYHWPCDELTFCSSEVTLWNVSTDNPESQEE